MRQPLPDILRSFFAAPGQPKLRRDLAAALRAGLGIEAAEAEATIDRLVGDGRLRPMTVHFYDPEVEGVVRAAGLRPADDRDHQVSGGDQRSSLA